MTIIIIIAIVLGAFYLIQKMAPKSNDGETSSNKINKYILVDNLLKRANEKLIIKDFKSAVAITDRILGIFPDYYYALTCRAKSLQALNFNLDAIENYEKALQIDNSDANIYGLLGITYRKIGEIDKGQYNLKISIQKGLDLYEMNYNMLVSASDGIKEAIIRKGKVPENLLRRNPSDFIDDLSMVEKEEFKTELRNQIHHLESAISSDPENKELKDIYLAIKKELN